MLSFNKVDSNVDLSLFDINSRRKSADKFGFNEESNTRNIKVNHAMKIVNQQWKLLGLRPRTIDSYNYNFSKFVEVTNVVYLHEINNDKIYEYLSSFKDVRDTTLKGRLKQISAVLARFYDNGWLASVFWKSIKIKVDTPLKEAATEKELSLLISLLDKSTFSGFRDSIAILLLYKSGIRIKTLGLLREKNIDFESKTLILPGEIMKSHRTLMLPLDDDICALLKELISVNNDIRKEHHQKNDNIFVSNVGIPISNSVSPSNLISKNLWMYSKRWGLKNVNPHSIRRLYGQNLLKRGADVNLISHAYGHSDLSTTSRYLGLDTSTVVRNLRDYL